MSGNKERPKSTIPMTEKEMVKALTEHFMEQINMLMWEHNRRRQLEMYRGLLYDLVIDDEDERELRETDMDL